MCLLLRGVVFCLVLFCLAVFVFCGLFFVCVLLVVVPSVFPGGSAWVWEVWKPQPDLVLTSFLTSVETGTAIPKCMSERRGEVRRGEERREER